MAHIDLSDVGHSNRLYSDLELHRVLELHSRAKQQYSHLLAMTDRPNTIKEVSDICAEIRRYEVALAPHRRLPTDVLREIFIRCTWNTQIENMVMLDRRRFPRTVPQLSVTYVCSLWRTVALCTRSLWNSLCIMDLDRQTMQCAEWWLARAKTLPVTIKICQFADISFSTLRHFLLAYHLKMLHFPIHSSGLDPSIPLHSIVYDLPLKHLAHLEEIRIRSWDHTYHIDLCAILKAAPNIRRVRFPRGGVRLSREALDDLAQCRLAPHLEWLTTGVVADPHDFLEMVKDRQKYVKEFRDTRLRPSLLRYLSISVDHTCDPKEIRIILASLGIKFRLLTG